MWTLLLVFLITVFLGYLLNERLRVIHQDINDIRSRLEGGVCEQSCANNNFESTEFLSQDQENSYTDLLSPIKVTKPNRKKEKMPKAKYKKSFFYERESDES